MNTAAIRTTLTRFLAMIALCVGLIGLPSVLRHPVLHSPFWDSVGMHPASSLFLSIILEAMPFIVLGVIISSLIHLMVPTRVILQLLPKSRFGSILAASLLGLVIPVCDCGTFPVARALSAKGVPDGPILAFILAGATINPVSLFATYIALGPHWMIARAVITLFIAVVCGWAAGERKKNMGSIKALTGRTETLPARNMAERLLRLFSPNGIERFVAHAVQEWFLVTGFVILSAGVAVAAHQYSHLLTPLLGAASIGWTILLLVAIGIFTSLCSEADGFVAKGLLLSFPVGSVFSFLLVGQLADVRNMLLLPKLFSKRVVIQTLMLCIVAAIASGWLVHYLQGRGVWI